MYVIRLRDGTLRVPTAVIGRGRAGEGHGDAGYVLGQAYVEIGPDDPDYERLLEESITEDEMAEKRRRWRAGDEALRREFEAFKAQQSKE